MEGGEREVIFFFFSLLAAATHGIAQHMLCVYVCLRGCGCVLTGMRLRAAAGTGGVNQEREASQGILQRHTRREIAS